MMKQVQRSLSWQAPPPSRWKRYFVDSLLALAGVVLVTGLIAATQLYPRIPTITLIYLLIVLALASTRGLFSAILASLLSFVAFDFFFVIPFYTFIIPRAADLFTLVVLLATAIITGQLASALRRRAEQALQREREIRHLYEKAQQLAALQERQRLARELHDSVSQALYGISLGAHTARESLANDPEQAAASIDYVLALTQAGLAEMRALIFELRPESLETEGLVAALSKQVAVLRTRHQLAVDAQFDAEPNIPFEQKQALYRIAQEALHNIVKHARATSVVLQLARQADTLLLVVRDDGCGFDPDASFPGHLGLRSMRERAAKVDASFAIESAPGQGVCIEARVAFPVERAR
ncbi:MAG: sensor histidine kinase [Ktedonobacteraceae bacterium]